MMMCARTQIVATCFAGAILIAEVITPLAVNAFAEEERPEGALLAIGDPSFTKSKLPPEMRKWYDRFWQSVISSREYIRKKASLNDTYTIGRHVNCYVTALMAAFRATGDLKILDEAVDIIEVARNDLKDAHPDGRRGAEKKDGYLNWLWKGMMRGRPSEGPYLNTDLHPMDEMMTHGYLAMFAYVLKVNSKFKPDYKGKAEFWQDYVENHFLAKWHKRGGIDKRLTHPYINFMRMHYYMHKLTGKPTYLSEAKRREEVLFKNYRPHPKVNSAFVWKHQLWGSETGWKKINYASYDMAVAQEMAMEKFGHYASDDFMKRFASTFRDVVFVNGTKSMANRVDGSEERGFDMYNMAGLARWDETGKLDKLAEQANTNRESVYICAYMLQALSRRSVQE